MTKKNAEKRGITLDPKVDIVKAAQLAKPATRQTYTMHPQEPELAIMLLDGEITRKQATEALKAGGIAKPATGQRMFKALQVAYDKGLIRKN